MPLLSPCKQFHATHTSGVFISERSTTSEKCIQTEENDHVKFPWLPEPSGARVLSLDARALPELTLAATLAPALLVEPPGSRAASLARRCKANGVPAITAMSVAVIGHESRPPS